jgi:hypothetical protein
VNVADLGNLATNFGMTSGATWAQGDFDYDGNVNVADLGDLATNFGMSLPSGSAAAQAAVAQARAGCAGTATTHPSAAVAVNAQALLVAETAPAQAAQLVPLGTDCAALSWYSGGEIDRALQIVVFLKWENG